MVAEANADPAFQAEFHRLLNDYVGRPSPLYFAERLTQEAGGARIYTFLTANPLGYQSKGEQEGFRPDWLIDVSLRRTHHG